MSPAGIHLLRGASPGVPGAALVQVLKAPSLTLSTHCGHCPLLSDLEEPSALLQRKTACLRPRNLTCLLT